MQIGKTFGALALVFAISGTGPAWTYSVIYAFGDSLSDAGNLYLADGGVLPAPPYAGGRFTNGPVWVQDLSSRLGLAPLTPSLTGGTDYAFGGAGTGVAVPGPSSAVPNLQQQVGLFGLNNGFVAPSPALYTLWAGSNDIFAIIGNGLLGGTMTLPDAMANTAGAAQAEVAAIQSLAGEGARHFLVPLLPDLGVTPSFAGTPLAPVASLLSGTFNAALVSGIYASAGLGGTDIYLPDVFTGIDAVVANPAAYGLTNVTDPCYVGPQTGGGTTCGAPDRSLFWDTVHPTAAGHELLADFALQAIPEPDAAAIVVAGLGLLALVRLRHRRPGGGRTMLLALPLLLTDCTYRSVADVSAPPPATGLPISLTVAPCTTRARAPGRDLAAEATRRFGSDLQAATEFALGPEGRYRLACEVVDYLEGNPIKRWIMPGWGETSGKVSAMLTDSSTGQTALIVTGEERLSAGGLYTIGAESYILDAAIDDLVRQLRAWARGEAMDTGGLSDPGRVPSAGGKS